MSCSERCIELDFVENAVVDIGNRMNLEIMNLYCVLECCSLNVKFK